MRRATRRLRDRAWMVAPLNSPVVTAQPDTGAADAGATHRWTTPRGVEVHVDIADDRPLTPELRELVNQRVDGDTAVEAGTSQRVLVAFGPDPEAD